MTYQANNSGKGFIVMFDLTVEGGGGYDTGRVVIIDPHNPQVVAHDFNSVEHAVKVIADVRTQGYRPFTDQQEAVVNLLSRVAGV